MQYQSIASIGAGVRRVSDDVFIPEDRNNRDWQAYQAWLRVGNLPLPPSEISLSERKAQANQDVVAFADRLSARLTAAFPAAEQASWPLQILEARAFLEGQAQHPARAVPTPLLSALLAAETGAGMPPADQIAAVHSDALGALAQAVLTKSTAFGAVVAAIIALRGRAQTAIAAAGDEAALAAAIRASTAEAAQVAKALGIAL